MSSFSELTVSVVTLSSTISLECSSSHSFNPDVWCTTEITLTLFISNYLMRTVFYKIYLSCLSELSYLHISQCFLQGCHHLHRTPSACCLLHFLSLSSDRRCSSDILLLFHFFFPQFLDCFLDVSRPPFYGSLLTRRLALF